MAEALVLRAQRQRLLLEAAGPDCLALVAMRLARRLARLARMAELLAEHLRASKPISVAQAARRGLLLAASDHPLSRPYLAAAEVAVAAVRLRRNPTQQAALAANPAWRNLMPLRAGARLFRSVEQAVLMAVARLSVLRDQAAGVVALVVAVVARVALAASPEAAAVVAAPQLRGRRLPTAEQEAVALSS